MAQRSIVPMILALLDPYLETRDIEWEAQPPGPGRQPTIPMTDDGKVNVRALTAALGLRKTQEQHFYRHPELAEAVNAVATVQGIKGIGSRLLDDAADQVVSERFHKVQARSNNLTMVLSEREAVIERQRREIEALRQQLRMLEESGMVLRTGQVR